MTRDQEFSFFCDVLVKLRGAFFLNGGTQRGTRGVRSQEIWQERSFLLWLMSTLNANTKEKVPTLHFATTNHSRANDGGGFFARNFLIGFAVCCSRLPSQKKRNSSTALGCVACEYDDRREHRCYVNTNNHKRP